LRIITDFFTVLLPGQLVPRHGDTTGIVQGLPGRCSTAVFGHALNPPVLPQVALANPNVLLQLDNDPGPAIWPAAHNLFNHGHGRPGPIGLVVSSRPSATTTSNCSQGQRCRQTRRQEETRPIVHLWVFGGMGFHTDQRRAVM
jgi:hypothetical protein